MAAVAIPRGAGQREWIQPREQLKRMEAPIVEELAKVLGNNDIAQLVAEYQYEPPRWYTALERIGMLPPQIPALPRNINQILNGKCPIHGDQQDLDGTPLKIRQTHLLYLIPPGTINELEARVNVYGQAHLAEYGGKNPLQFRYFWNRARQEHGDIRFHEWDWILMSKDILPASSNEPYERQVEMVGELSGKGGVNYEVPSLRAAVGVAFLHKIATKESILQAGNQQNGDVYTYTRVRETTDNSHFVFGGSDPSGMNVYGRYGFECERFGVSVLRKF